jgi:ANTAR domain.
VDISAALATDLAILRQAFDDQDNDLELILRAFSTDIRQAVSSYLGMTMTIALDGAEVSFAVNAGSAPQRGAGASLLIPLAAVTPVDAAGTLLLYAATPGAFVDLAADLSYALGIDPTKLLLDSHLVRSADAPADLAGLAGLHEHIAINQAIGILIARGHTPGAARDELHRRAALAHRSVRSVAEALIRSVRANSTDST